MMVYDLEFIQAMLTTTDALPSNSGMTSQAVSSSFLS